jgi:hypothetical protein
MDISEAPPLEWRILNDETQIASKDGRVVAITYTVNAGEVNDAPVLEFCWVPVDEPDLVDVHFGVSPGTGSAWDTRWARARKATEWDVAVRAEA